MTTSLKKKLLGLAVLGLLVAGLVVIVINWERTMWVLIIATVLSTSIATIAYVPALCYFLVVTRSLRESHARSCEMWLRLASALFSEISSS